MHITNNVCSVTKVMVVLSIEKLENFDEAERQDRVQRVTYFFQCSIYTDEASDCWRGVGVLLSLLIDSDVTTSDGCIQRVEDCRKRGSSRYTSSSKCFYTTDCFV
jgi:hypothetical protein